MAERPRNRVSVNIGGNRHRPYFRFMPWAELEEIAITQAQLEEIPKVRITEEQAVELIQCAVCLDEFKLNEEEIRKLPCNHMYHDKCIFPWLENNQTCPACREPLPNLNDSDDGGDDLEDIIRQHFDRVTADLMRHIAESGGQLPALFAAAAYDHTLTRERQTAGRSSTREVPQRAAALRARRAIQQIYR